MTKEKRYQLIKLLTAAQDQLRNATNTQDPEWPRKLQVRLRKAARIMLDAAAALEGVKP